MDTSLPTVHAEEVNAALIAKKSCILLDVRTKEEYARGRIPGSLNLPVDEVEAHVRTVIPDTSTCIYVYCLSGSRSPVAVTVLQKLGYSNVFDMSHGLLAWRIKGYPVVS